LTQLKALSLTTDYTPAQLRGILEKKHLFQNLSLRVGFPECGITPKIFSSFLKEMSPIVTSLSLVLVKNPTFNGVFPPQHSFGQNLTQFSLLGWKGSLEFVKGLTRVTGIQFLRMNLEDSLFLNSDNRETDLVAFFRLFNELNHLKKICVTQCEAAERISFELMQTLPNVRVGIFADFEEATRFMYPPARTNI
jgi:hypothetical protein